MTSRERVRAAVGHRSPDEVLYDNRFTQTTRAKRVAYFGDAAFESCLGNCFAWFRPHLLDARFVEVAPDIPAVAKPENVAAMIEVLQNP
ncbi:MAG TPA: hypothetical protein PLS24_03215 [Sedimentisphaerales bacterium]|nr:hypothetical protein [Sedimentisphaerales bacterium]